MKVLELFGGYGSQALALENLGIDFESDLCEIDKYAIQAYNQLHGETHNWGDICKIDETQLPHYDLITYSSPCQDFSVAGKQAGGDKGSGTRSSLLWECERIIKFVKPKYLLMENVKNLVGKKHIHNFTAWLRTLEEMGYKNWWKVLNAKDYGVPQNRERVFVVSILGGGSYQFPEPIKLEKRLKDILEQNVDKKYYLSDDKLARFKSNNNNIIVPEATKQGYAKAYDGDSINLEQPNSKTRRGRVGHQMENTLTCSCNQGVAVQQVGNIVHTGNFENPQLGRIYSTEGCSPSLNTVQGGGLEPKVIVDGYFEYPNSTKKHQSNTIISKDGISTTLDTMGGGNLQPKIMENFRIRKLTPRECWRLMGVRDEQFNKLHDLSNAQLYKMAGNSIVVDVLMAVFKNMFFETQAEGQLELL